LSCGSVDFSIVKRRSDEAALSWQLTSQWQFDPDEAKASEIVVRFRPEGPNATRVELEHRHFERHGPDANSVRAAVSGD
jgi:hypothetical protein